MTTGFLFWQAVELIDGEIGPAFAAIRKQREAAGSAYFDAVTYAQGSFSRMPEALRPKPGRLSLSQQRVYDVKQITIPKIAYVVASFLLFLY